MAEDSLFTAINNLVGGAGATLLGATAGRMMYHSGEVKAQRRRFFGWELLWEIPVVLGMGLIGEGLAYHIGAEGPVSTSLVACLAYLGPRGMEVALTRFIARGGK